VEARLDPKWRRVLLKMHDAPRKDYGLPSGKEVVKGPSFFKRERKRNVNLTLYEESQRSYWVLGDTEILREVNKRNGGRGSIY